MADLEEAIRMGQEAVTITPKDHPDRAGFLNNLGSHFSDRYSRTGAIADLEKAIRMGQETVTITLKDHPDRAVYLNNFKNLSES